MNTAKEWDAEYFEWLCNIIALPDEYISLAMHLHGLSFYWTHPMDENRNIDALDLRAKYYGDDERDDVCSVFEMMVALANRIENDIMYDCEYENRTGLWFEIMLENLGLDSYTNEITLMNGTLITEKIYTMLDREYDADGHGALFTVEGGLSDMRSMEIWDQMMYYLNVNYF